MFAGRVPTGIFEGSPSSNSTSMLKVSALLLVLLGAAHSILGERYILTRLFRRADLPQLFGGTAFTTRTLRFAWHVTTVAWFGIAALLWQASSGRLDTQSIAATIGYTSVASGFLPLLITRGRHLSWMVFFLVGGLCLWASTS